MKRMFGGKMEKRIFRVLMLTVLLVFVIVIVMETVQNIAVRYEQSSYIEELETSGRTISAEYRKLTDESLLNLAGKKAAEADKIFSDCGRLVMTLRNTANLVLTGYEGPGDDEVTLPQKDAEPGKITAYFAIPDDVDTTDPAVIADMKILSSLAPIMEASVDPEEPIYGCQIVTRSGPVLMANAMEAQAAEDIPLLNDWSSAYRNNMNSMHHEMIGLGYFSVDIITEEGCCVVFQPILRDDEIWGMVFYQIDPSYFDELVKTDELYEQDICFITNRDEIDPIVSSEETGIFRSFGPEKDRQDKVLAATEEEASEKLLAAFEQDSGQISVTLNHPLAGSKDVTLYYRSIITPDWMLVIGRSEAFTAERAEKVSNTIADVLSQGRETNRRYLIMTILIFMIAITVAGVIVFRRSRKYADTVAAPIRTLTRKVEELNVETLEFEWKSMGEKDDETEILAVAFDGMTKRVREDILHITEMTTERERIRTELSFATSIQQSMLPPLTEEFTNGEAFTLYAIMRPAREVGGDFFDFFMIDPDHLAFLVADVSDKGVGAALFMAISKSVIRTRTLSGGTPGEVMKDADELLSAGNNEGMFVTVFFAIMNLKTGEVIACNAGHDYPVVCFADGETEPEYVMRKENHGVPVAFNMGLDYPEIRWKLSPGDRIFLYTDGVNEAQGKARVQFEMERVCAVLNKHKKESDQEICESMLRALDDFYNGDPQFDDITMLSVTYRGTP